MNRIIIALVSLIVFVSGASFANDIVECKGTNLNVTVSQLGGEIFLAKLKFPSGGYLNVQTNGIIRTDRGFATRGTFGLVYTKDAQNELAGWLALNGKIFPDLTCKYLQ